MTDGTFTTSDGGALAGGILKAAVASTAVEINQIQLGTGPLGPQPFGVSDGGNLASTAAGDDLDVCTGGGTLTCVGRVVGYDFITGGGTLTAVGVHRAHRQIILHGGGALTWTGARVTAFAVVPGVIYVTGYTVTLGTAPPPTPAPLLASLGDDVLPVAPGTVVAYVVNGTPDGDALFSITGIGEALTVAFDDTGSIGGVSVPVNATTDGIYDLVVTDLTSTLTATVSFTVVAVSAPQTIGATVTTPPVNVQPNLGVKRWVFQDPATAEVYHFPINPSQMNTPFGPKKIQFAATTAVDGQKIAFEGQTSPVDWQFEGVLFTQAQYDAFVHWASKRNRIWITDHFGRAFLCYITHFQPIPRRDTGHYWTHNWTMNALIFEGPVNPT